MKRWLVAVVTAALVGGCSFTRQEPLVYHVLRDPAAAPAAAAPPAESVLLVAAPSVESFYDTTAIAFSRSEGTRGHYQFAFWTERPGRALQGLMLARLESAGLHRAVAPATSGVAGHLELQTELRAIYHDASAPPGFARVRLTASLVDRRQQRLLARRTFERTAAATDYSAAGAVDGFNAAVGGVLDDLVVWLREAPAR
ncbi:MAG: ABC-type transport auxiliary lipoprotein family protein [Pseudomonadota bacterium]